MTICSQRVVASYSKTDHRGTTVPPPYKAMRFCDAAISTLLFAMSTSVSEARDRISVTADGIEFNVDYFDDSRIRPYRVVSVGTSRDVFDFDTSGIVEILRTGTERYRVSYRRTPPDGVTWGTCPNFKTERPGTGRRRVPPAAKRATLCLQSHFLFRTTQL